VATETDAARDRVLAARTALGEEFETLEASARTAVDIPAKVRRNPAKTAAIAGGTAFIVAGGPRRTFRRVKRAVRGPEKPLPSVMLPQEIEKTLRSLGSDGDKVRGTIERDFAAYTKQAQKDRTRLRTLLFVAVLRPLVLRASRAAADAVFRTDEEGFQARLAQVQSRIARREDGQTSPPTEPVTAPPSTTSSTSATSTSATQPAPVPPPAIH
jgi:hypothetical protein